MEKKHLILIGFMGSGKSTIGAAVASRLQLPLIDTDKLIEKEQGLSVATIFKERGEMAFRQMEKELLYRLAKEEKPLLISTGGGLPVYEDNGTLLKQMGLVIWLDVNKTTILKRLKNDTTRPLLHGDNVEERVEALLAKREDYYRKAADVILDVNHASIKQLEESICSSYRINRK